MERKYLLGTHNSWSFLKGKKWWMNLFRFVAQCQDYDIKTQYEKYGVRCFDLRVKYDKYGNTVFAHGKYVFDYNLEQMSKDLLYIDKKSDCFVRIIHEARTKKEYTEKNVEKFRKFCSTLERVFANTKFWNGNNLYNGKNDYKFVCQPSCEELYSSVQAPKLIDDWIPRLYAFLNNKKNAKKGTDKDILLIDFVNYL